MGCVGGGIIDIRFIRRVSVGLMVLAPKPLAWDEWPVPGIMDARLLTAADALRPPRPWPLRRGERAARDRRFDSTPKALRPAWAARGGGCTDLALAALDVLKGRVGSEPSIEVLVESEPPRSEARLGRRRWALEYVSESMRIPGPTDFLGGLAAALTFETGGYWL